MKKSPLFPPISPVESFLSTLVVSKLSKKKRCEGTLVVTFASAANKLQTELKVLVPKNNSKFRKL